MPWYLIFAVVMLVASFAITALTTPKSNSTQMAMKPNAITDFQFPTSDEGTPQAVIFGDVWSPDHQILWYGRYRNSPIKQAMTKLSGGGKKG